MAGGMSARRAPLAGLEQPTLFSDFSDYEEAFSSDEVVAARSVTAAATRAGIALAEEAVDDAWKDTVYQAILTCAQRYRSFTVDDVLIVLGVKLAANGRADWSSARIEDRSRSAVGGLFQRAAREGLIENSGRMQRHSIFAQRHRPLSIWDSLIFLGDATADVRERPSA